MSPVAKRHAAEPLSETLAAYIRYSERVHAGFPPREDVEMRTQRAMAAFIRKGAKR